METVVMVEKKASKKMGASYKRSHKKQNRIVEIGSTTPIKPVNIRDDTEFFERPVKQNSFHGGLFYPSSNTLAGRASSVQGNKEPEYSLRYMRMLLRKSNAETLVSLELETIYPTTPRMNVAINFAGGEVVSNRNVIRYFKILDECGISKFISDSIQEMISDIRHTLVFRDNSYIADNYPGVTKVVEYISTKNIADERIRREFNSQDFSDFSKDVCSFIYNEKLSKLKEYVQRYTIQLGHTVLNSLGLLTNRVTTSLNVSSIVSEISDALMSVFSGKNGEKSLLDMIDDTIVDLEEVGRIKESYVNLVPERRPTVYGGSTRYPK